MTLPPCPSPRSTAPLCLAGHARARRVDERLLPHFIDRVGGTHQRREGGPCKGAGWLERHTQTIPNDQKHEGGTGMDAAPE